MVFQKQESEQPYGAKDSDTVMEQGKPERNSTTSMYHEGLLHHLPPGTRS
jgi:hypothetical protein